MKREYTSIVNWIFDNLFPPILRDNYFFMAPFFWVLFKNKKKYFMQFKENAQLLSDQQYVEYYKLLGEKHIQRETDLNQLCIAKIIDSIMGPSVLDIACGRGYLAKLIWEKTNFHVTGIDIDPPLFENDDNRLCFQQGSVESIKYEDNTFDTVICAHTLEHIRDLDMALRELRRVARQRLIVVVPRQREYRYTFDLHLNFFPYAYSLQKVMKNTSGNIITLGNDFLYMEDIS